MEQAREFYRNIYRKYEVDREVVRKIKDILKLHPDATIEKIR